MVDRNISSHEAQASSVSDGTHGENAGVESVYARNLIHIPGFGLGSTTLGPES